MIAKRPAKPWIFVVEKNAICHASRRRNVANMEAMDATSSAEKSLRTSTTFLCNDSCKKNYFCISWIFCIVVNLSFWTLIY